MVGFPLLALATILCGRDTFGFVHEFMTKPELARYFQVPHKKLVPQYEIVYLPTVLPIRESISQSEDDGGEEVNFDFTAFGRPISLKLRENNNLMGLNFQSFLRNGEDVEIMPYPNKNCHYLHRDSHSVAAFSICDPDTVNGLVFLDNSTLEVSPLSQRLQEILKLREPLEESSEERIPHIVRRAPPLQGNFHNDSLPLKDFSWLDMYENKFKRNFYDQKENEELREASKFRTMTLELSLFFDEAAYKIFAPYMNYDNTKIQDMLLAYLNGVQALYHHHSLGRSLELVLVRMDIMKNQPSDMPHYEGERSKLLDSFCDYQNKLNPPSDSDPGHWDMALYISGLDFFAYENGRKNGATMGLATVGGVCLGQYACIIAELGTTNLFGKPYPSAGFTSVYILAHEIGHNLGMHHDSTSNSCPKEGYIMSPSRGTQGETQWSSCSADVMSKLGWATCLNDQNKSPKHMDHSRYLDAPGHTYTAKKQCEILLKDRDAIGSPNQELSSICYSLQCKTPHRSGFYFAGPALDGTECGRGKYCYGGDCVKKSPPKPLTVIPGGWGPWKEIGSCNSGCIEKSRGYLTKKRICNNPVPVNTDKGCEGASYEIALCKDESTCRSDRKSVVNYASEKCKDFADIITNLDRKGAGLQAPHEEGRLWMGCAIFCKRKEGSYYTPRIELNDLGVSPYFPDGTWCHQAKGKDYYCVRHHCLPEDFKFSKTSLADGINDIDLPQNARPDAPVPPELQSYFSLGSDGKPLLTSFAPGDVRPKEEEWETDDYVLLPDDKLNEIDGNLF